MKNHPSWSVTKTYGHAEGLSVAFRQWRATHSRCSLLHGYSLSFSFTFRPINGNLDSRNWVQDFGGLKELKKFLVDNFDHTTLIASDDPQLELLKELATKNLLDLRILKCGVGCERFAEYAGTYANELVLRNGVYVESCSVSEHAGNSATWFNPLPECRE